MLLVPVEDAYFQLKYSSYVKTRTEILMHGPQTIRVGLERVEVPLLRTLPFLHGARHRQVRGADVIDNHNSTPTSSVTPRGESLSHIHSWIQSHILSKAKWRPPKPATGSPFCRMPAATDALVRKPPAVIQAQHQGTSREVQRVAKPSHRLLGPQLRMASWLALS